MDKEEEFLGWNAPVWVYLESPHAFFAPQLKYRGEYIAGGYFCRYKYKGTSVAKVPLSSWLPYGQKYLKWLVDGDRGFVDEILSLVKETIQLADKLELKNAEDLRTNTVTDINEFFPEYKRIFSYLVAYGWDINTALDRDLRVQSIPHSEIPEYGQSFIWQENNELYEISKMPPGVEKEAAINEHALKYSWILNNYNGDRNPGVSYFQNRINNISPSPSGREIKKGRPKTLSDWIGYLTFAQDQRKRLNMIANGMLDRALRVDCERRGHSHSDAMMLTVDEYEEQKNNALKKYGNIRHFFTDHDGIHDLTEQEWYSFFPENTKKTDRCVGIVANKGIVQGVARIILSPDDFYKFKEGEILITSMTRPEFSPVMGRAAAIVTDEGGITSHAAIVSREMKKPCIIGTKNATRVLRDGDLVEVDAEKGIVKVLKRSDD